MFTRLMGSAAVSYCKYWRAALQDVVRREIYICIEISNFQLKQTISACSRGNGMHSN